MTYPKIVGFVRSALIVMGWAALSALIHLLTDPANLAGWISPVTAGLIVSIFSAIEAKMQAAGKGALFGAVR